MYDCMGAGGLVDWTSTLLKAIAPFGTAVLVAGGVEGSISQDYLGTRLNPVSLKWSGWFSPPEIDDLIDMLSDGTIDLSATKTTDILA